MKNLWRLHRQSGRRQACHWCNGRWDTDSGTCARPCSGEFNARMRAHDAEEAKAKVCSALAPRGDNLPKKTWRPNEDIAAARANHAYPQAGCQGSALSQPCSDCFGVRWEWIRDSVARAFVCMRCNGTGRVLRSGWDTPHCG